MSGFNKQYQVSARPGESTQDVLNRHFKPTAGQRIGKAIKTVRKVGIGAAKIGIGAAAGAGIAHGVTGSVHAAIGGAVGGAVGTAFKMHKRKVNRMMLHN